jgi:streptogramin lyase
MSVQIARVAERFKSPGPQPNGLHAAEDGLWYIDQVDLKIYKLDYATGETLFAAQTDTEHSSGITFGNGSLWIASTFELNIAQLDPATGQTIAKHDSPGNGIVAWAQDQQNGRVTGAHGLEWKDGKVYVAAPPSQFIHVMNAESWAEVHSFRAPGLRVHGLAWADDGTLWVADTSAGTISRLDPEDGRVWEVIRVEAPVEVHGLTIHEGVLWYCDAATRAIGQLYLD